VLPYLRRRLGITGVIKSRVLRTCSIGESHIDELIGDLMRQSNPTVGLAAHPGQTDVRITAKADDEREADALIAATERDLRSRLGDFIYGTGGQTLEELCVGLLRGRGQTVALAETSQGVLTTRLGAVPTSTEVFRGATLAPDGPTLFERLSEGTDSDASEQDAPANPAVAIASRVRRSYAADYGIAVIPSPAPDAEGSQDALLALATPEAEAHKSVRTRTSNSGDRLANTALDMLRRAILGLPQN
jgi:nicotinamide-nucleotide amidase